MKCELPRTPTSGRCSTLAFPPFGLWPLIFVAFVPMVVGTHWLAPPRWGKAVIGVGIGTFMAGQLSAGEPADAANAILGAVMIATLARWDRSDDSTSPAFQQALTDQVIRGVLPA